MQSGIAPFDGVGESLDAHERFVQARGSTAVLDLLRDDVAPRRVALQGMEKRSDDVLRLRHRVADS